MRGIYDFPPNRTRSNGKHTLACARGGSGGGGRGGGGGGGAPFKRPFEYLETRVDIFLPYVRVPVRWKNRRARETGLVVSTPTTPVSGYGFRTAIILVTDALFSVTCGRAQYAFGSTGKFRDARILDFVVR